MNVFTKYSQNQNPPSHLSGGEISGLKQDSDSSSSISSIQNATVITTNTSPSLKDPLNLNNNNNSNNNSKKSFFGTLKPLQSSYNSANNSNLVMGNQKPQFSSPISINNTNNNNNNSTNNNTNGNISLPSLIQVNSNMRSNTTTRNNNCHGLFSSSNSHISINDDTHGRNGSGGGRSPQLSLLLSGSSHHNKLSTLGGQLEQLTSARPKALTPLPIKTSDFELGRSLPKRRPEPFDFRTHTPKSERNSANSTPIIKNNAQNNIDGLLSLAIGSEKISPGSASSSCSYESRLEQVSASKCNEILKNAGYLIINGERHKTSMDDLTMISELGSGTCGQVYKMKHNQTGYMMAVKQMGISGVLEENQRIIMDLDVVLKSRDCDDIVKCLGFLVSDCDVWICMELMYMCFDKLLKLVKKPIPEEILCKMSVSVLNALNYLKQTHKVIHRDIKPSNILIDENGQIKLCDFGISGNLIDSIAKSRSNAGCAGYMAPERIDPPNPQDPAYDIRADVWSLGVSLVELATGEYPYHNCNSPFEVMAKISTNDAPHLKGDQFTNNFKSFVNNNCLVKDVNKRPKYNILLQHPLILQYKDPDLEVDVKSWLRKATRDTLSLNKAELIPMSSLSIDHDHDSTSTTPTATTSNLITTV